MKYLRQRHDICLERLEEDCHHPEARLLKRVLSEQYSSRFLLDYEYEIPGVSKGDALLCKAVGNRLKVLVLEVKHINYSPSVNKDTQKNKKKKLRKQILKYEAQAEDYIAEHHPILKERYYLDITAKGCYNDRNDDIVYINDDSDGSDSDDDDSDDDNDDSGDSGDDSDDNDRNGDEIEIQQGTGFSCSVM